MGRERRFGRSGRCVAFGVDECGGDTAEHQGETGEDEEEGEEGGARHRGRAGGERMEAGERGSGHGHGHGHGHVHGGERERGRRGGSGSGSGSFAGAGREGAGGEQECGQELVTIGGRGIGGQNDGL